MPEYLAPGVYVEETSYRAKAIEGVSTSTAGFVGQCRYGPVGGPPVLVTSVEEFQRRFGSNGNLLLGGSATTNHLAHAVRAFFENGGKRLYIARIFSPTPGGAPEDHAARGEDLPGGTRFRARFPGQAGNLELGVTARRSPNLLLPRGASPALTGLRPGDMVEVVLGGGPLPRVVDRNDPGTLVDAARLGWAAEDGRTLRFPGDPGTWPDLTGAVAVHRVSLGVEASDGLRSDSYRDLSTHRSSASFIGSVLRRDEPYDRSARIYLDHPETYGDDDALALLERLANGPLAPLAGGTDGSRATVMEFRGSGSGNDATGLEALAEIDDIAIVAAPGGSSQPGDTGQAIRDALITHCEGLRYRMAILAGPGNQDLDQIRDLRGKHDSTYAALYYPWVVVRDPNGQPGDTLHLPPEGFMAGIYARSDIERGVHKAPANEVVRGALRFERPISQGVQEVLNPEGINCLRFFEGRGYRAWGARTISSDPEWIYLNVRRLLIFLEHSIDRSTQWAVFEPNNETLWLKVQLTVESFLQDVWLTGALLGRAADEAFFVRCDRTTMTQGDLDNGRLVCLVGVAPVRPAEFVIFRIGQWTAEASII